MNIVHIHHIIPRHSGGTDDPSNLIELTIEEHAEAHHKLWVEHDRWQDFIAWKGLSGQINQTEISFNPIVAKSMEQSCSDNNEVYLE